MERKWNCWDFKKCGKGPSENGNGKSGRCPVAREIVADTLNGGINGGRICWIIADAKCRGNVKCSAEQRENFCFQCEFRYKVIMDEGLLNTCKATGILLHKYESAISVSFNDH